MLYIVFGECVIVLSQLTDHLSDLSRQVPLQTLIFHPSPSDAHCLTPPHHSEGCLAEGVAARGICAIPLTERDTVRLFNKRASPVSSFPLSCLLSPKMQISIMRNPTSSVPVAMGQICHFWLSFERSSWDNCMAPGAGGHVQGRVAKVILSWATLGYALQKGTA